MPNNLSLTTVVLSKNEQDHISGCLESLSWSPQVLVIDDYSTDNTVSSARKFPHVKIINHHLSDDFSAQRNFALSLIQSDWILFIDADERVSAHLAKEIQSSISNQDQFQGFFLHRQDHIWGKTLKFGDTAHAKLLRLAKKDSGIWKGQVHEVWDVKPPTSTLSHPIDHFPHPGLSQFLTQINYYSTLRAQELYRQNASVCLLCVFVLPIAKFFQNYFLRWGILDGPQGFAHALAMSFHSFLVRTKLYLLLHRINQ